MFFKRPTMFFEPTLDPCQKLHARVLKLAHHHFGQLVLQLHPLGRGEPA